MGQTCGRIYGGNHPQDHMEPMNPMDGDNKVLVAKWSVEFKKNNKNKDML